MSLELKLAGVVREVRGPFDRESMPTEVVGDSMTMQQFAEECDINNLLRQYKATGLLRQLPQPMQYGDVSELPSYQEALNTVIAARAAFEALPSDLRTRFENDPGQFVDFVQDPANKEELYELGLAERPKPSDTDRIVEALKPAPEAKPAPAPATPPTS